jgi:hypothetical protein
LSEFGVVGTITFYIAFDFVLPERAPGLGNGCPLTSFVPMEKTGMHKNDLPESWHHDVGRSGQVTHVETKAIAHMVNE